MHYIRVPKGEEREKGTENIFENIVPENFPNMGKKRHSGPRCTVSSNKTNPERCTSRHIIIKIAKIKDKERILKAAKSNKLHTRALP